MPLKPVTFDEKDLKRIFKLDTPLVRFWRYIRRTVRGLVAFGLVFGLFFLIMNAPAFWQRASYASQPPATPTPTVVTPPVINYAPEIIIDKIGVRAPVIYDSAYADIIPRLRDGVVRYEGTANPGEIGNVVILGHSSDYPWSTGSYKTVFALLDKLAVGDEIILPYQTNRYVYRVTVNRVVKANDLTVLSRTDSPTLTLVTCYPVGTALKRLIIRANLVEGPTGPVQATEPFLGEKLLNVR